MSMNYSFSEKPNIYKTIEILKNGENKYENLSMSIVGMTFADMKSELAENLLLEKILLLFQIKQTQKINTLFL